MAVLTGESFGQMVYRLRQARRWSQTVLGQRAGIDQSTVSQIELDKPKARTASTVRGLAQAFAEDEREWLVLAGVIPEQEAPPRVVVVRGPGGDLEVPIERVVAYVESFPNARHQDRLARWRARHDTPTYQRLCARVFVAWSSNYELLLDALDVAEAR